MFLGARGTASSRGYRVLLLFGELCLLVHGSRCSVLFCLRMWSQRGVAHSPESAAKRKLHCRMQRYAVGGGDGDQKWPWLEECC